MKRKYGAIPTALTTFAWITTTMTGADAFLHHPTSSSGLHIPGPRKSPSLQHRHRSQRSKSSNKSSIGSKEHSSQSKTMHFSSLLEDIETVESHTTVLLDEDTQRPLRQQMVYVDEYNCIGCTACALIADQTFFMESENGRARVFQQWGDDDDTIKEAITTCPVDCIHYVPYEELQSLEIERRDQVINFKERLVGGAGSGSGQENEMQFLSLQRLRRLSHVSHGL